jgi:hypothetical protein
MFEQIASFVAKNVRTDGLFAQDEMLDIASRMYELANDAGYDELDNRQLWNIYEASKA